MAGSRPDRRRMDRPGRRGGRGLRREALRDYSARIERLEPRIAPAIEIWTGAISDFWNVDGNWEDGTKPVEGDDLVFPTGASNLSNTNDYANGTNFGAITIESAGYTIDGNLVNLNGTLTATYSGVSEIQFPIDLQGTQTFDVATGGELFLNQFITGASGAGLTKTGGGTLTLGGGSNANTYDGLTTVTQGVVGLFKDNGIDALGGNLLIDGTVNSASPLVLIRSIDQIPDTSSVTLNGEGASFTIESGKSDAILGLVMDGGTVTIDGDYLDVGAAGITVLATNGIPSTITGAAGGDIRSHLNALSISVADSAAAVDLEISAEIGSATGLTKSGVGTLRLSPSASSAYSGSTNVDDGELILAATGGASPIPAGLVIGDGAGPSARVKNEGNNQIPDASDVIVQSDGTLDLNNFDDTIASLTLTGSTTQTGTGTLTVTGDITTNASSVTALITGNLALGIGNHNFTVADGSAGTDLTVSADISGTAASITKTGGASAMSFSGNNTYDGATIINTGGIIISHPNGLGATSAGTTVASGALIGYQGGLVFAAEPVTISGNGVGNLGALWSSSGANTVTGTIFLAANSFIGAESSAPLTIVSQITDGVDIFNLTKVRSGSVTLTNANPYNGTTTISAGTLAASNSGSMGTGAVTVASGATLALSGDITPANSGFTLSGSGVGSNGALRSTSGTNTISSGVTLSSNTTVGVNAGTLLVSGAIDGSSSVLTKTGDGVLQLDGTNTYDGGTALLAGTLLINGVVVHNVNVFGGTLGGSGSITGPGESNVVAGTLAPGPIGGTGILSRNMATDARLQLQSGATFAVDLNGTIAGTSYDRLAVTGGIEAHLVLAGTLDVSLGYLPTVGDAFDIATAIAGTDTFLTGSFTGLPNEAEFTETYDGAEVTFQITYGFTAVTLTVTDVSRTFIWDGGDADDSLWSSPDNWVGDVAPMEGSNLVFPSGASRLSNTNDFAPGTDFDQITVAANYGLGGNALDLSSGIAMTGASDTVITLDITLLNDVTISTSDAGSLYLSGVIDDGALARGLVISGTSTGRIVLIGDNAFDSGVNVTSGFLRISSSNALGDPTVSTTVTVGSTSSLELHDGITIPSTKTFDISGLPVSNSSKILSVSGDNAIQGDVGITGGNNVSFDVAIGTTLTVSGTISGSRDFDKNNFGTLVLSGTNTHTGNVNVGDGTLVVSGSLATSNLVFVDGQLSGSGTLPSVSISPIGRLAPGSSPGILATGDLSLSTGSTHFVELNGTEVGTTYDQVDVTGSVNLDSNSMGGASLSVSVGYPLSVGDSFVIIKNDLLDQVTGTFNGLAEGATFVIGNAELQITYAGGENGNDVVLTVTTITAIWDGGDADDSLWSSPDNWVGDVAPTEGSSLVFPSSASRLSNTNDFAPQTDFADITIAAAGYTLAGNMIDLVGDVLATYAAGTSTIEVGLRMQTTRTFDVADGGTLDVAAAITGTDFTQNLLKAGGGTLRFSGSSANIYANTFVNAGTLALAKTGVLAIGGALTIGNGTTAAQVAIEGDNQVFVGSNVTVNEGSTLNVGTHFLDVSNLFLQGATVQIGAGGLLELFISVNSLATTNNVTSTISGAGSLAQSSGGFLLASVADDSDVDVDLSIDVKVQDVSFLSKSGGGKLALTSANTYDGFTSINDGTIAISNADALGSTVSGTTVSPGGTLELLGGLSFSAEPLEAAGAGVGGIGAIYNASGSNTLTGTLNNGGPVSIGSASSSSLTISGVITDVIGSAVLSKIGPGRLRFTTANTYISPTQVDAGVLEITADTALGSNSATVASGAALELGGGINVANSLLLSGTGIGNDGVLRNISGGNILSGGVFLGSNPTTIGVDDGSLTIGTVGVSGSGNGLLKVGAGTLILDAPSISFSGNLNVAGGRLDVNNTHLLSAALINAGSTLGGSGFVGATSVLPGGTINPGPEGGTGALGTAALLMSVTSTFHVDLDGTTPGTEFDQVNVTGVVSILIGANLSIDLGFAPAIGDRFKIIDNDTLIDPVVGTFAGLPEGSLITIGNVVLKISYVGGDGNDVVLTTEDVSYIWDGGDADDNLWSSPDNWVGDVMPTTGSRLTFPAAANRLLNVNDLTGFVVFSLALQGSGYQISGNPIHLVTSFDASYSSGTSAVALDIDGTPSDIASFSVAAGGQLDLGGAITDYFIARFNGPGTFLLGGSTSNTASITEVSGGGTLLLAKSGGALAASGFFNVSEDSTARLLADNQLSDSGTLSLEELGTFDLNGFDDLVGGLNLYGSTVQIPAESTLTLDGSLSTSDSANHVLSQILGPGTLDLNGDDTTQFSIADDTQLEVDLRITAVIVNGGIYTDYYGTFALAAANTYAGETYIAYGAVYVENALGLGSTAGQTRVDSDAAVYLAANLMTIAEPFDIQGTGQSGKGVLRNLAGITTLTGPITLANDARISSADGCKLTISGVITDNLNGNGLMINQPGDGLVVLDADNAYNASTVIDGGIVRATRSGAFGDPNATVFVNNVATLQLSGGISLPSTKPFVFDNEPADGHFKLVNRDGHNTLAGPITYINRFLPIDVAAGSSLTLSGTIAGTEPIDKLGTGTLVLSGTSSYLGQTNVYAGTILVNGSIAASSLVTVDGVLGGTGTVPAVSVSSAGTIAPGQSPGILNAGSVTLVTGSTFAVEIEGATVGEEYDQLNVRGTVTLGGSNLSASLGYTPLGGQVFRIVNNDGLDAVSGTFVGLPEGSVINFDTGALRISYVGGDGNDVTLTALATPTVGIASSVNPSELGQLITFTVTVSGSGVTPSGSGQFSIDGSPVGLPVTLDGSGQAQYSTDELAIGSHSVTFAYLGDSFYYPANGSLAGGQDVTVISTTTAVSSDFPVAVNGALVTFSVIVTPARGPLITEGVVAFYNGATLLGTGPINDIGVAVFTTTTLTAAGSPHAITAQFLGSGNYGPSTSAAFSQSIIRATSSATLASTTNPSSFGQAAFVTATFAAVAPGTGTPTGTVEFFDGATSLGVFPLVNGTASLNTSGLTVGSHSITAVYGGNADFQGSTSTPFNQTVSRSATSVGLTVVPSASVFGQSLALTANVAASGGGTGNPTGTVSYFLNGNLIGTADVVDGSATLNAPIDGVGSYVLTASYSGDANFEGGTSPAVAQTVAASGSATTLSQSTASPVSGQPITYTVNVAAVAPGSGSPSGLVTFRSGDTVLGTANVVNGVATFTTAFGAGTQSITATYGGSTDFTGSVSAALSTTVGQGASTATFAPPASVTAGLPLTLTATILPVAPATGTPTGTASFFDGDVLLATVPLVNGTASYTVASPTPGTHAYRAVYSGDANFAPYSSPTSTVEASSIASAITLTGPSTPQVVGTFTTFTATVSGSATIPTGLVAFYVNGAFRGNAELVNGVASITVTPITGGTLQSATAEYLGSTIYLPSASNGVVFAVEFGPTTVALAAGPAVNNRSQIALISQLAPAQTGAIPTGTITYLVNGRPFRTVVLDSNGRASTNVARAGSIGRTYLARYNGDINFAPSVSEPVRITRAMASATPQGPAAAFLRRGGALAFADQSPATSVLSGRPRVRAR